MKPLTFAACAAVVAALAGCTGSSSTNPLAEHTLHGTLTCQSVLVSGNTVANEVSTLFTDNQAISGQWANAEAEINTTATAAQVQAITDLLATVSDLGTGTGATGSLVPAVVSLDNNAKKLTNTGASGWRSAGPAVSSDISTLNKTCAADVTGQSHVG
ncbi:MAG: hypothetical protein WAK83_04325 [Trebonia sp.]|jgi:hypothetical protein|uniref:hypothetical protein n=1 Tax=Trebonia sp. TaxID=2767075 RepID=UPI003BB1E784